MPTNFYMLFVVALIPLILGAVYYHPKLVGGAWMKSNGFTEESLKGGNMALIFGLTYLFSFFIAFALPSLTIHQTHVYSMLMPEVFDTASAAHASANEMMAEYGNRYRTFGHGAVHGFFLALTIVLPVLSIVAMFERRGWKYVLIHFGYWVISLILMAGVVCQVIKYT